MFFLWPITTALWIYVLLAILPAIFLMVYVYNLDRVERESPRLLVQLVLLGVLAGFLSVILEMIGESLLNLSKVDENSDFYKILLSFLVVGIIEEGTKYLLMGRRTWRDPEFNYRFDAIVYAVFTSLGFAAMENIEYAFMYGPTVLLTRALMAIPGHCAFAVVFGVFYGRAKLASSCGESGKAAAYIAAGYLLSVFFHGFYDSCAMIGSTQTTILMIAVVVVIYIVVFRLVRAESDRDEPVA